MKTVKAAWDEFAKHVLPLNCSAVQLVETRRAYYAGAYDFFRIQNQIASEITEGNIEAGAQGLEAMVKEIQAFWETELKMGRGAPR